VTTAAHGSQAPASGRYLAALCMGALGVVYGDIGTSPLYALKECFGPHSGLLPTPDNVLGILSLVLWSLLIVISLKYLVFVMRADNRGEGGILALMALLRPRRADGRLAGTVTVRTTGSGESHTVLVALGLFGAALLYGDGMITPAISVLSALEGLEVVTPAFRPYILPGTIVILLVFFAVQRKGTGGVGAVFGPVTLVWFLVMAGFGTIWIVRNPSVLAAVSPTHAVSFFLENRYRGFLSLGSVFLVVTGGEALYADMGHFGPRPIRLVWAWLVLPALLLNYFGQGALLLVNPKAVENPFYRLAPAWALLPLVALATAATVIASQAVVSGAFSLTRQAVQLGFMPRLEIRHTSAREIGQIYIPSINWALAVCTIGLVLGFRTSSNLAGAYGVAVTATMVVTTLLLYSVSRELWGWSVAKAALLAASFLVLDLGFFLANIIKLFHGGWFPLLVGAVVFVLMTTWKRGRAILADRIREKTVPLAAFLSRIEEVRPVRVPGTAVYLLREEQGTPPALFKNVQHNRVLHERNLFVSVVTEEVPRVDGDRLDQEELAPGFHRLHVRYGFMEDPDLHQALASAKVPGLKLDPSALTYILARETLLATDRPGMAIWRERLFSRMSRNARGAAAFFHLPPDQVIEIGSQIEL